MTNFWEHRTTLFLPLQKLEHQNVIGGLGFSRFPFWENPPFEEVALDPVCIMECILLTLTGPLGGPRSLRPGIRHPSDGQHPTTTPVIIIIILTQLRAVHISHLNQIGFLYILIYFIFVYILYICCQWRFSSFHFLLSLVLCCTFLASEVTWFLLLLQHFH